MPDSSDKVFAQAAQEFRDQRERRELVAKPSFRQMEGRSAKSNRTFPLLHLGEIEPRLDRRYLIKGWLDRGAASVVYGQSNVGKTFLALDVALHVAAGKDWRGNRVAYTPGGVVYIAGEGGFGIRNRIEALRRERSDLTSAADLFLLPQPVDVVKDSAALLETLHRLPDMPALIVIDTLARCMGSGDENSAQDMGRFVAAIDLLRDETGAHVMVVHHTGKDSTKGARGSSALRAAVDTEIELTRSGVIIVAETCKQRDMPSGQTFSYVLRDVVIGTDEDGDEVTSAVVEPTEGPVKRAPLLKGQALIAMQAFGDALADHGEVRKGEAFPPNRQCVSLDHWREYCNRHALSSGDGESSNRAAFHKQKNRLQEKGLIRILDGFAWRCDE